MTALGFSTLDFNMTWWTNITGHFKRRETPLDYELMSSVHTSEQIIEMMEDREHPCWDGKCPHKNV